MSRVLYVYLSVFRCIQNVFVLNVRAKVIVIALALAMTVNVRAKMKILNSLNHLENLKKVRLVFIELTLG